MTLKLETLLKNARLHDPEAKRAAEAAAIPLGRAIGEAEAEELKANLVVTDERRKRLQKREGAYVALGREIVSSILAQKSAFYIDMLIDLARWNAIFALQEAGITGDNFTKHESAIKKGISRAKISAQERVTGRTRAGRAISVPIATSEADYNSTETEADRQGRANAAVKTKGNPESADRLDRLRLLADEVSRSMPSEPGFQTKLQRLLEEIGKLPK